MDRIILLTVAFLTSSTLGVKQLHAEEVNDPLRALTELYIDLICC